MNRTSSHLLRILALNVCTSAVLGCGKHSSAKDSPGTSSASPLENTSHQSEKNIPIPTFESPVNVSTVGVLESRRREAHSTVSTCNLIHVGNRIFIAPEHCVKGSDAFSAQWDENSKSIEMKIIERIQPKSLEVDALVFLQPERDSSITLSDKVDLDQAYIKDTLDYPADILLISRMPKRHVKDSPCRPLRYNADGLIAYACDTSGGMSGALLVLKSSRAPIGIHLGRKSGVGYGVAFNAISRIARDFVESTTQVRSPNR